MKEISLKLYRFNELSEDVRSQLVEDNTSKIADSIMNFSNDEWKSTLDAFADMMRIRVYDWEISYSGHYFNFKFEDDTPVLGYYLGRELYAEDVCGKYLRRYLNNNFLPYILTPKKYYKFSAGYDRELKKWNKQRYSRIFRKDWKDCPLTGCCYDYSILEPIFDVLSKPIADNYSLKDLIDDTLSHFFQEWQSDFDYWYENKDNCIEQELEERNENTWFLEDGTEYKHAV